MLLKGENPRLLEQVQDLVVKNIQSYLKASGKQIPFFLAAVKHLDENLSDKICERMKGFTMVYDKEAVNAYESVFQINQVENFSRKIR